MIYYVYINNVVINFLFEVIFMRDIFVGVLINEFIVLVVIFELK